MALEILTPESFQTFCEKVQTKSFMQSLEMAELLSRRGCKVTYLGFRHGDDIQVAGVLYSLPMTGGLHMEINSGPASLDQKYLGQFYQELQNYAKTNGALELIVKPYDTYQTFDTKGEPVSGEHTELIQTLTKLGFSHDGLLTGYPGGEPDWHYVKDLSGLSPDTLRKSFSKKGRPLANKTASFGIKIRKLKRDELHLFKEITAATSERREYADKSLDYYQDFYDSFKDSCEFAVASINFQDYITNLTQNQQQLSKQISNLTLQLEKNPTSSKKKNQKRELQHQFDTFTDRISEAREFMNQYGNKDIILAGSLFIYTPQEAIYLFSGSYPEFNKFYAPVVLQEHVMLEAIKRGITFYNFLGITGEFDGSDGVLRFKQNFNGYIVRKMGTFRYYPSPIKYKFIQGIKKLLGRH